MRIAINLAAVREDMTGPVVYCSGFLSSLAAINQHDEFLVFMAPEIAAKVENDLADNFKIHPTELSNHVLWRVLWEQIMLPVHLNRWGADVLFAAFDISPLLSSLPVVLGVRNPMPVRIGNAFDFKGRLHRILSRLSCQRAKIVFYPTNYASRLLGDALDVSGKKRTVVNHGTDHRLWAKLDDADNILAGYGILPGHYFLYVSNFYPYKQPDLLIEEFYAWYQKHTGSNFKLVIVGEAPKAYESLKQKIVRRVDELSLDDRVIFTGHVPRMHLPILYHYSAAFILPTLLETFGQPFVEAMACGTPVICSDTEFARELCADAALYVPSVKAQSLSDAMAEVVNQPDTADRLRTAGLKRAGEFSWHREARETLELLKTAGKGLDLKTNRNQSQKAFEP